MGRPPIGTKAMTSTERSRRYRAGLASKRDTGSVTKLDDGEFNLFASALRTLLKAMWETLDAPGRKPELRNAMGWQLGLVETLLRDWPSASLAQKQWVAKARNPAQMMTHGACEASRAVHAEMIMREVAANPNWPDPPPDPS